MDGSCAMYPHTDIILIESSLGFTILFEFIFLMLKPSLVAGFASDHLLRCSPYCHTTSGPEDTGGPGY